MLDTMPGSGGLLYLLALLLLSVPLQGLAQRLRLPCGILLVGLGFASSELLVAAGLDTGVRWQNFHFAVIYLLLPALVFEATLRIDLTALRRELLPVAFMALPLTLVTTLIIAAALYYGIGHPRGFPWEAALLTGALLSATDPSAILGHPDAGRIPRRLRTLLESEGLFNDVTAIVLFGVLVTAYSISGDSTPGFIAARFLLAGIGGVLLGLALGWVGRALLLLWASSRAVSLVSLAVAYGVFIAAEQVQASGVMAVLTSALVLRGSIHAGGGSEQMRHFATELWRWLAYLAENLIFLLSGITITLGMFSERWYAMLLAIGGMLCARFMSVCGLLAPLCLLPGQRALPWRQQSILIWGGGRGAVTLALALALPVQLDYWYTVQSAAYGAVVFALFVQAATIGPAFRRQQ